MFEGYISQFRLLSRNVKFFLAGNVIQAFGLAIYTLLFNLYLKELQFSESTIGNLISTSSLGIALMAIPASLIIERFHVKHLVMVGMFIASALFMLQVQFSSEIALFTLGLAASSFQALFNITVSPFYLRNSTPQVRMHLFTINSALVMVSNLFGFLIGGFLPELVQNLFPESETTQVYRYALVAALAVMFSSNLMFAQIQKVPIPRIKKRFIEGLKEKDWPVLARLILPKLCFAFGGGLIIPFMNLYLKEKFNLSTQMIGMSYALLQFFIFAGIFITPFFMKRMSPLKFILSTSIVSIPFMILMGITGNIGVVLGCFFLRGMLMNMSGPITSMFEMEKVKEQECVFASAMILFFYNLVYTSSTRLGGALIERYDFGATFYVAAAFYALAVVLYYRFFKQKEEVSQPEVEWKEAA